MKPRSVVISVELVSSKPLKILAKLVRLALSTVGTVKQVQLNVVREEANG